MQIYTKTETELTKQSVLDHIRQGKIFIHPTDTIYGLGCDATNEEAVKKLRDIKSCNERPFSIVVPNKTWIRENCVVNEKIVQWIKKLPGPYTLILKLKNGSAISDGVNNGMGTIGIRILDHWIQNLCEELGRPIVSTSANRMNGYIMTSLENLDAQIKSKLDFAIYEDEKDGKPSTIIDLTKESESITER